MKKSWKIWLQWIISIVSIGLLIWTLRGIDFIKIWEVLRNANYIWLIPAVIVYFVAVWFRVLRWKILLDPVKRLRLVKLFPVVCIGYMGNNIYPARAGEILRSYILKEREDFPISSSLMTVLVERIFDGIVVLAFVFITFPLLAKLIQGDIGLITNWAIVLSILFLIVVIILILLVIFPGITQKIINWIVKYLIPDKWQDRISVILTRFIQGLESLRSPKSALVVLLLSIIIWLIETCTYFCVTQVFSLNLSFYALMMLNGSINLFTLIPAAPGYIGTFELAGKTLLTAYRVPADIATGFTLILHATLWLPITLIGALFFLGGGLKISKARQVVNDFRIKH